MYTFFLSKVFILIFTLLMPYACFAATDSWEVVEPGLDLATFPLHENSNTRIVVLRFNPNHFDFSIFSISENSSNPKTLMQWAQQFDLVAAINASMYLPDGKTSTGYMRSGEHINNKHLAKNFGAFFLSRPYSSSLASVRLIDRDTEGWEELLGQYHTVIQNFRLIDSSRQVLWSTKGQAHSIAAVAQDNLGNILFLHCRQPILAHTFASTLLTLPINVRTVMYVEGGVQAGLVLRSAKEDVLWGGWHPSDIFVGSVSVVLPNVLGVQRKPNKQ